MYSNIQIEKFRTFKNKSLTHLKFQTFYIFDNLKLKIFCHSCLKRKLFGQIIKHLKIERLKRSNIPTFDH